MKTKYIFLMCALAGMFAAQSAGAQTPVTKFEGGITVWDVKMTPAQDSISLTMSINVADIATPSKDGIAIVPVLSKEHRSVEFPYVLINGKWQHQSFKRKKNYRNRILMARMPVKVVEVTRKHVGETIDYSYSVKREEWMDDDAMLSLKYELISPEGERNYISSSISAAAAQPKIVERVVEKIVEKIVQVPVPTPVPAPAPAPVPEPVPVVAPVIAPPPPPVVTRGSHSYSGAAFLDFEAGKSALLTNYKRNPEELAAIKEVMSIIQNNPGTRISKLEICGYASPEGSFAGNGRLAKSRADAFASYLQRTYGLSVSQMKVTSVAEDWKGLRDAVSASTSLPAKAQVLAVIDSSDAPDVKEAKLRSMMRGQLWQNLVNSIFPRLRRVTYKIDYVVSE